MAQSKRRAEVATPAAMQAFSSRASLRMAAADEDGEDASSAASLVLVLRMEKAVLRMLARREMQVAVGQMTAVGRLGA